MLANKIGLLVTELESRVYEIDEIIKRLRVEKDIKKSFAHKLTEAMKAK